MRRSLLLGVCALCALALPAGAGPAPAARACVVPKVVGLHLVAARVYVSARGCRVGRVVRVGSVVISRRRVIAQQPRAGRRLPAGARVNLVVSAGTTKR